MRAFIILMALCVFHLNQAHAAEYRYAPKNCEFEITFPEKFYTQLKCGTKNMCEEVVTFAKTIKTSTADFRVTCNAPGKEKMDLVRKSNLKASAKELATSAGLKSFGEDVATLPDGTLSAVTLALGKRGTLDALYTGQYWIGKTSLLLLEAEMRGPTNKDVEKIYSDILKSVKPKTAK